MIEKPYPIVKADYTDAIIAGSAAAVLLIAEHYAFQRGERSLKPPVSYILGTATLGTALTWWAQRRNIPQAGMAFWLISGIGGAATVGAYAFDALQDESR